MSLTPAPILAGLALLLLASSALTTGALAQAVDAVVAERPAHRSAVGRTVYPVPRDLLEGGSVSDMLRTLPFVEVDADGEISLRGDPNVTILLDGRSSIELSAGWRALALQRMPASGIESVEIITGISAEFPSGGAGVINIVTKARKPAGGASR
jgi:outer membrane receptor for ferrienterochelin and colicin